MFSTVIPNVASGVEESFCGIDPFSHEPAVYHENNFSQYELPKNEKPRGTVNSL